MRIGGIAVVRHARRKQLLKQAKGFRGRKKNCFGLALDMVRRKKLYEYRDRRSVKTYMRQIWIQRINGSARELGYSYSKLCYLKKIANCTLNNKMLAEICYRNKEGFKEMVNKWVSISSTQNQT